MPIPPAEFEFTIAFVEKVLKDQCPDLKFSTIKKYSSGWDNEMYLLDDKYLVRFPRRQKASHLIRNEQKWLPLLTPKLNIAIPRPIFFGEPQDDYPWHWSVVDYIEGATADKDIPAANQIPRLVHFLKNLHTEASDLAPENEFRGVPLKDRIQDVSHRFERIKQETDLFTEGISDLWDRAIEVKVPDQRNWIHGDLHPLNMIVNDGVIVSIIDWGDITYGDVATDLVCNWMLFSEYQDRQQFIQLYGMSEDLLLRAQGWVIYFASVMLDTGLDGPKSYKDIGIQTFKNLGEDLLRI